MESTYIICTLFEPIRVHCFHSVCVPTCIRLAHLTCSESVRPQDSKVVQGRVDNESHVTEVASAIPWPLYRNRRQCNSIRNSVLCLTIPLR